MFSSQGANQHQHHRKGWCHSSVYIESHMGVNMSTLCFISLEQQVIFFHRRVRVEMDCSSTALIFKEPLQPVSPSSIIWVLSDTHGLLSQGDAQAASRSYHIKYNSRGAPGRGLFLMDLFPVWWTKSYNKIHAELIGLYIQNQRIFCPCLRIATGIHSALFGPFSWSTYAHTCKLTWKLFEGLRGMWPSPETPKSISILMSTHTCFWSP